MAFLRKPTALEEESVTPSLEPRSQLLFFETVPSSVAVVGPLLGRLFHRLGKLRSLNGQREELEIALREAIVNAIVHGNGGDSAKRVDFRCFLEGGNRLWFVIRDQGSGFDPGCLPDPTEPVNLHRHCGRGIFLIRHFMDTIEFAHHGREIRMCKKLPQVA